MICTPHSKHGGHSCWANRQFAYIMTPEQALVVRCLPMTKQRRSIWPMNQTSSQSNLYFEIRGTWVTGPSIQTVLDDWRVKACSHMEILKNVHTELVISPQIHTPSQPKVNFLVKQTWAANGDKEEHRNWFRTRMFRFGGTLGGPLYFTLRSYNNLHELSRVDAH